MSKRLLIIICIAASALALPAQAQQPKSISIDALANNVVSSNPERRFYVEQIHLASAERAAAGRLPDPELAFELGQRRTSDIVNGAPQQTTTIACAGPAGRCASLSGSSGSPREATVRPLLGKTQRLTSRERISRERSIPLSYRIDNDLNAGRF